VADCFVPPVSRGSTPRRAGFGGDISPAMLQLNVPTHCMPGYTQDLQAWFPKMEMALYVTVVG
jgi:hypothetical protein